METPFYQVDVFSDILFGGNPLAVFLKGQDFKEDQLQKVAREMNLSEAGDELIKTTLRVANGRLTCAEALGHKEFVMTKLYRSA